MYWQPLAAAGQVEEIQEIPAGHDPCGHPRVAGPADMGAMRGWQSASRREVLKVLDLDWFRGLGLVFLQDYLAAPIR